jgi:Tfp pilus assembly protein PilX
MKGIRPTGCLRPINTQRGMVLLLCLIFLTAMMLLGLSASADTILQNQLTANLQETDRVKQSALAALIWAEKWLLELDGLPRENCRGPCGGQIIHAFGSLPANPEFKPYSWWIEQGFEAGTDPLTNNPETLAITDNTNKSIWLIEPAYSFAAAQDGSTDQRVWYRIFARASNTAGTVVSVVESLVVRSWPSLESTEVATADNPGICSVQDKACGRVSWRELR